jgi:hypothetical protein
VLDAAAGRSLRGSGPTVEGTAGLTWTIDVAGLYAGKWNPATSRDQQWH